MNHSTSFIECSVYRKTPGLFDIKLINTTDAKELMLISNNTLKVAMFKFLIILSINLFRMKLIDQEITV